MATQSDIQTALSDIAQKIRGERAALKNAKDEMGKRKANLAGLPGLFADEIATITAYVPTGTTETYNKELYLNLKEEFLALEAEAQTAVTALASITEF